MGPAGGQVFSTLGGWAGPGPILLPPRGGVACPPTLGRWVPAPPPGLKKKPVPDLPRAHSQVPATSPRPPSAGAGAAPHKFIAKSNALPTKHPPKHRCFFASPCNIFFAIISMHLAVQLSSKSVFQPIANSGVHSVVRFGPHPTPLRPRRRRPGVSRRPVQRPPVPPPPP